ncbi:type II toxin-antitoxin system VapB family antitoxin [Paraneptunicella aestuarii]|uniref:type II toxin-antitoxin system VapB family antitoxin n=1 Tax=Paraneptunicella aestuarii TaxID=2831148 RepID=UPI001E3E4D7D|nr:type II toxin-antitoxin system VapB family antitoxin [Paraneptunicella aestuarii]UAA38769.1 type II toxin-antitoxin system VapB family antitoxin [Paraneptunicella aestuarii]
MRTNIIIDDQLMADALKYSGLTTKKEAVEQALTLMVKLKKQEQIRKFRGKLQWDGNLDDSRTSGKTL